MDEEDSQLVEDKEERIDEDQENLEDDDEDNDDDDDEEDEEEEDTEEDEEGAGEKWIDVRVLEKMSLEELKQLGLDERTPDLDRRLDPPITKLIVRRLPPQITIESYLQELSEVPKYSYIRLVPPNEDLPSRIGKRSAIYINFETEQEAFWFKEKYNKMKFFDERGNSYIACVDFSFFQDVFEDPPADEQVGTLETSDIFEDFLKKYEEDPWSFTMVRPDTTPTPEIMLEEILNKKVIEPGDTPLLQFVRERSEKKEAARREREVKRKEKETARREAKEREKERQRERREKEREKRKERERERQKERDRERRLRKEKEKAENQRSEKDSTGNRAKEVPPDKSSNQTDGDKFKEKERGKGKEDKEAKQKAGSVTYSRSGNVTRWSENSGPRKSGSGKQRKDDDRKKSQEKLNSEAGSSSQIKTSDKLPLEKDTKSEDKPKAVFGKPFPSKEAKSDRSGKYSSDNSKNQTTTADEKRGDDKNEKRNDVGESGTTKKRIVKKVIKVRKVVKDEGGAGGGGETSNQQESSETKHKRVIRVVKKSAKSDNGDNNKSAATSKKEDTCEKGGGDATTAQERHIESEKERKTRRGRPEIQIYRPGSLRAGGNKPSGEKDRSDNISAGQPNSEGSSNK